MLNEMFKEISTEYNPRFGQISVKNGYVTPEQVKKALVEQLEDDLAGRPHRLLGQIMADKGWMTAKQIKKILTEMLRENKAG